MNRKPAATDRFAREAMTWSKATFAERGAELDAIGSAIARCETCLNTLCTEFKNNLAH